MKTATYIRMSTDKQEDSPERQRKSILAYIQANGMRLTQEYIDEAERGWDDSRPGFRKLLADAQAGKFQTIVVDECSRLSRRDPIDFFRYVAGPLRDVGVTVHSVAEGGLQNWDPDNLPGTLLTAVYQDRSRSESKKIAWRVTSNFNRLAAERKIDLGKAPYGYKRVRLPDGVYSYIPDPDHPEHQEVVRFIFDAYVNRDMSFRDIGRELEQRGIPTPAGNAVWSQNCVGKILKDLKYAGYYVFNRRHQGQYCRLGKETVEQARDKKTGVLNDPSDWRIEPNSHEPLVSPELFARAQERMVANRTRTTPSPNRGNFLFTGMLVCGRCGHPMQGHRNGPEGEAFYRCGYAAETKQRHCFNNLVKETELLDCVLDTLETKLLNPAFIDQVVEEARKMDDDASSEAKVQALRKEFTTLEKDIERARGRLAKVDDETFEFLTAQIKGWVERKKAVETDLGVANAPTHKQQMERLVEAIRKYIWQFREAIQSGDRQHVRATLRTLVAFIEVHVERKLVGKVKCKYLLTGGRVNVRPETELSPLAKPEGRLGLKAARKMAAVPAHNGRNAYKTREKGTADLSCFG